MSIERRQISGKFFKLIMNPASDYGMAIGNLTVQAGSNLNLSDFDKFVIFILH